MTGWCIAGGAALWCALAVVVTWIVAGSARLRDRSRPVASAPTERRPACCSKDVEGPLHHETICTASPCCVRCPQVTGILTVPVSVSDAELDEIRRRAKPGTAVRRAEPQGDGWVL